MASVLNLDHVCPDTLPVHAHGFSQIWNEQLSFQKGEQVLVTAPSGKGKSTFIALLYGLRRDYSGTYRIDGKDSRLFSAADWSDLRAHHLSIVFQDLRLFMDYTVMQNLAIKSKLDQDSLSLDRAREMASLLGIEPLLERKCGSLSYGERQRVAIIRSLLQPADFRIMDEPFSHLDEPNTAKALDLIVEECRSRQSGLIITSLGSDYGWFYDRIVLL